MPTSSDRLLPLHRLPSSAYAAAHPPAPNVVATSHTGAGIFVLSKHGWLAGLDAANRWQDFGGNRETSESPWQTAAREFEEETGVSANYLVSLAPPYRMVKNEHIYVIHIMMVLPGAPPLQTNLEILMHKHFVGFSNKFVDEVVAPSIVHRRVLDAEFLVIAAKAHNELLKATRMPAASLSSVTEQTTAASVPTRSSAIARYSTAYRQRPASRASSAAPDDSVTVRPSVARVNDCPSDVERGGLPFEQRQFRVERRLDAHQAFEPSTRDEVAARRCGESARECLELAAKMRAANSSGDESDADGYETDTNVDALDDDDDDDDGDESLATFSSAKTIHESDDVVRIAAFPSPPLVERADPTEVDWEAAMPVQWPEDLADLFADNPAGARTWKEVEAAMLRLVDYHAVRDMSHILSVMARFSSHAGARTPAHAAHAFPPHSLLADAAHALCF